MPSWGPNFVNKIIFILFLYLYNKHRLFVSQLYIKETDTQLTHDWQGESCKINRLWMYKTENTFFVLVMEKDNFIAYKFYSKKKKWTKQIKVNNNDKQRSFLYDCNTTIFMWLLSSLAALITCCPRMSWWTIWLPRSAARRSRTSRC